MEPLSRRLLLSLLLVTLPSGRALRASGHSGWCGTSPQGGQNAVWAHRERSLRRGAFRGTATGNTDVGDVAVLLDQGDLAFPVNLMDLQGAGLEFSPVGRGYRVARVDRPVVAAPGVALRLGDDDSQKVALPFPFPFYGHAYTDVFINSDGNLTFVAGDNASTDRDVGRVLSGPPRICPLFTDLNPAAGGTVTYHSAPDQVAVTWSQVPQFGMSDRNTLQVRLWPDGRVDFAYDPGVSASIAQGVVGVAPGHGAGGLTAVDFSDPQGVTGTGALVESFQNQETLDLTAVAQRFYGTHPDSYQQLVVFTSRSFVDAHTFAFEENVKNLDTGIGLAVFDLSADYGSQGHLESVVLMDAVQKYAGDLTAPLIGPASALSVLAQESGHRWLVNALFRDGDHNSQELLGRDMVHWSFFVDTDASHLEGNQIQDLGGGQFLTVASTQRYSAMDQYLMGLLPSSAVSPFFFVRNPMTGGDNSAGREPQTGVAFSGVRKDVTVADVIGALGKRSPPPGSRPPFRQAFLYVTVGPADPGAIGLVDRMRAAWEPFFLLSVSGHGSVDTHLR